MQSSLPFPQRSLVTTYTRSSCAAMIMCKSTKITNSTKLLCSVYPYREFHVFALLHLTSAFRPITSIACYLTLNEFTYCSDCEDSQNELSLEVIRSSNHMSSNFHFVKLHMRRLRNRSPSTAVHLRGRRQSSLKRVAGEKMAASASPVVHRSFETDIKLKREA